MSCQMGFYNKNAALEDYEVLVYQHNDGEPENVIDIIVPILKDFVINRGSFDVEHAAAWLVAKLKTGYTNIGVGKALYSDLEYYYAVYPDHIDIYDTEQSTLLGLKNFKKIDTIKF